METKGRVKVVNGPRIQQRKNGGEPYTITEIDVQIGVYQRNKPNYQTNTFETVTEADMVRATYFGDEANNKASLIKVGDVVSVSYHHYINQYGRTETVIESIMPANVQAAAQQKQQALNAQMAQQPQQGDKLPF